MQLLVIGMHRSGTSAISRLLNLMGAYFGPEGSSIGYNIENLKGFWEREDVINVNQDILKTINADWYKVSHIEDNYQLTEISDKLSHKLKKLVLDFDSFRPWFVKDPRLCISLPYWMSYLEVPLCIYVYRNPTEVASSLHVRNGFPTDYGMALWEKYNYLALKNTLELKRYFVDYDDLVNNPLDVCDKLYDWLLANGVNRINKISKLELEKFIDKNLHRQRGDLIEVSTTESQMGLWDILNDERDLQEYQKSFSLDKCNEILQLYENRFVQLPSESEFSEMLNRHAHEKKELINTSNKELTNSNTKIQELQLILSNNQNDLESLKSDSTHAQKEIEKANNTITVLQASHIAELEKKKDELEKNKEELEKSKEELEKV